MEPSECGMCAKVSGHVWLLPTGHRTCSGLGCVSFKSRHTNPDRSNKTKNKERKKKQKKKKEAEQVEQVDIRIKHARWNRKGAPGRRVTRLFVVSIPGGVVFGMSVFGSRDVI